jgi:hypothetical protein
MDRTGRWAATLLALAALEVAGCYSWPHDSDWPTGDCPGHACVCRHPTVRALAHDLDALERQIEQYGSISVQAPSIWGQARLTKHREDFEKQIVTRFGTFNVTLQGSLYRSDQAYLVNALALNAALSGQTAGALSPQPIAVSSSSGATNMVTPTPISVPTTATIPSDIAAAISGMKRNDILASPTFSFLGTDKNAINLEPITAIDEEAAYLNHLNELRRINEGDDTADSPGYALNLIRVPVSVLPGKCTRQGYGAEVTMTLRPNLNEELLPTTYRNLVLNDLLAQISVPMTELLNDCEIRAFLENPRAKETANAEWVSGLLPADKSKANKRQTTDRAWLVRNMLNSHPNVLTRLNKPMVRVPATWIRNARRPFPPSQIIEIYGLDESLNVLCAAYETLHRDTPNKYYMHFPDVQSYLAEELNAAYAFLAHPDNADLWQHCSAELVTAIRSRDVNHIQLLRDQFEAAAWSKDNRPGVADVTVDLAWAVIVESALLNEQLIQDMHESASLRGCACQPGEWAPYYLPDPPPEARQAFNEYVRCRWPIHVFALDPVTQQQNIADIFSQRRELQLALSLAFVSGNISASNFLRYARRLELDVQTVALNATAVSFSHGDDTFGWRFYPRFQTPEIESNATAIFRDLLLGGPSRDALLRQRRLEPGQRECLAIVIMPSFVPYATLDVSSSWFSLTNPKRRLLDTTDAVELSARLKAIQDCADRVADADCYRDGDLERLSQRARQLEARLPLQTLSVQVPYENTLGGFAMFNTGLTDLAPELYGWYGAPGIDLDHDTTLFLIGNHFSVHQTRVAVGGHFVDYQNQQELLSRQVIKVIVPKGAVAIERDSGQIEQCAPGGPCGKCRPELFVDVQVATPYGVTSHLLIPACHTSAGPPGLAGPAWAGDTFLIPLKNNAVSPPDLKPAQLVLKLGSAHADVDAIADLTFLVSGPKGGATLCENNLPVRAADAADKILLLDQAKGTLTLNVLLTAQVAMDLVAQKPLLFDAVPAQLTIVQTNLVIRKGPAILFSGPLMGALNVQLQDLSSKK